jgi:hypothetical protein
MLGEEYKLIKARRRGWAEHITHMGDLWNSYSILVRKPKGNGQFRRHWHRWENPAKIVIKVMRYGGIDGL